MVVFSKYPLPQRSESNNISDWLIQSKKDGKDQESIQSSTTPDPGYLWKSNKLTASHHKRELRSQDNLQIYYSCASATVLSKVLLLLWESVIVLCFVVRYFMSILVLQSSSWGRELVALLNLSSWCLVMVDWLFSWCHRVICGL